MNTDNKLHRRSVVDDIEQHATKLVVRYMLKWMTSRRNDYGGQCTIASSQGRRCDSKPDDLNKWIRPIAFDRWCDICKAKFYLERIDKPKSKPTSRTSGVGILFETDNST